MTQATIDDALALLPKDYESTLKEIKKRIQSAQQRAVVAVNQELIALYWEIGRSIGEKLSKESWGAKVVDRLAKDLKASFPTMKGFSTRNIYFMVQFARTYQSYEIVKQLVSQIPWGHNVLLIQKIKSMKERLWYAKKVIEQGWSRRDLERWIASKLYARQGRSISNFDKTLPATQTTLANELLKDPFCFDFLTLREKHDEQELEAGLIDHIQRFLLELGAGFSFVGRQFHLEIGGQDFYVDLLFYHYRLRCFVVVELKATEFKPEFAGKLNFYLSAIDDLMKHPEDQPTIGLLLCKEKNGVVAEYALRGISKPIGISDYETAILNSLPDHFKSSLPSIEEIERELENKH